jgi:hypothetical protein
MPRSQQFTPDFIRLAEEQVKLDVPVALHARVRSKPLGILSDEILNNGLAKLFAKVQHVIRNPQPMGNSPGILYGPKRATPRMTRVRLVLLPDLHRNPHHRITPTH